MILSVTDWLQEMRRKHAQGQLADADFDELEGLISHGASARQQLLYLQAGSTSPLSRVVGMALFVPGERHDNYSLEAEEFPYQTVIQAVEDGWRIVQFPVPPTDFSDQAVDYVGFEFILERWALEHAYDH
jgi:hypothetical protein